MALLPQTLIVISVAMEIVLELFALIRKTLLISRFLSFQVPQKL